MTSRRAFLVLVALAGCASEHRRVAPLVYDRTGTGAARSKDALGAPPGIAPAPAPTCAAWKEFTLSNGMPLFVAERHSLPSAAVRLVFSTGAMASSEFAGESARRLDLLAATYLSHHDADGDLSGQCTIMSCWIAEDGDAADVGAALGRLASRVTVAPSDANSDARRFATATDSLFRMDSGPGPALLRNAEVMAFWRPSAGPYVAAAQPTLADVIQARAQLLRPAAATLVVAGDVSAAEAQSQAERAFGSWRSDREEVRPEGSGHESPGPSFVPRVVHVPHNPWALSLAAIVARGPASSSHDSWAFRVAVQILAGGMGSEFFARVREDMAASYAPGAQVRWFPHASVATLGGLLEPGKVIAATRVMLSSVRAVREQGPEPEALARAKTRTKVELQRSVSTNSLLVSSLEVTDSGVRPVDPCEAATRIDAITPEDVRAAMGEYFAEQRLGVVVIASEVQLDAWPADLDMGKVQRRDWLGQDLP